MIYGPNPDERAELNDILAGVAVERLPVQYEVQIEKEGAYDPTITIKAFGVLQDDAEEIAAFARRVIDALYGPDGDGE